MQLQLDAQEAEYLGDILQMWAEGIEAEVPELSETAEADVHWTRFQLRKQLLAATSIKMRLDLEREATE